MDAWIEHGTLSRYSGAGLGEGSRDCSQDSGVGWWCKSTLGRYTNRIGLGRPSLGGSVEAVNVTGFPCGEAPGPRDGVSHGYGYRQHREDNGTLGDPVRKTRFPPVTEVRNGNSKELALAYGDAQYQGSFQERSDRRALSRYRDVHVLLGG